MIYKIVQGNSFKLHILVRKPDISSESNMLIDFDMTKATDIKVSLVCNFGENTIIPAHVSMALPNVVVCDVPSTLEIGNYNVSVSWRMDGNDMASVEKNLFRIVEYNSQAQYPICMVEGENCKETKIATAIVVLPATIELWQLVNLTNATLEEADILSKKIADAEALRVDAEKKRESAELTRNKQVADAISNINKAQANNIKKIEQTTTSIESGGINVITITTGNGTTSFEVRNGSKGEQGEKGEKGDKGEKGEKGEQGTQGIQGAKGDTGSKGERGLQGERGEKGDMGSIGRISISVDNTTGAPSATATASNAADGSTDIYFSFKGIKGEKGEKGERGEQGLQGERGEQGFPGNDGAKGDKGDKGDAFKYSDFTEEQLAALKGDKGDIGLTGPQGETGPVGPQGETGPVGPQGVKGDPFTYSDFTEAQIKELQKPATDAATKAQEILKNAETATTGAENVNAELEGNVLKVTNRNGEIKSLDFEQWDLEEKVNISISTSVDGVSVKGIVVNVFLNGAVTSTKYTSDAEGKISFAIPRGTIYRISFQELKNCDPLPSLTYTAALRVRDINVEYKALSGETASVVVTIDKAENGAVTPLQGVPVTCEIANGDTTTTETNKNGKVTFSIPWGKTYKITAGKAEGYYAFKGIYEKNNVADVAEHNLYYHFFPVTSGVFILDTAGAQYTLDEWQQSGKTEEDAALVKITTQNLAGHNSSVGFSPSALQAGYPSKQWCTQNVLFNNIPTNGNNTNDALYYDGYKSSKLIREEAQERGLTIPAFSYAYECTVEMAGETLHGYIASVGQMAEMKINRTVVDNVIKALYGDTEKLFSSLFVDSKWTSTQGNATSAWSYSSSARGSSKSDSSVVLPVYAC